MSKFDALWDYVEVQDSGTLTLTFEEVERIAGIPIDHSFLTFKQELLPRGWGRWTRSRSSIRPSAFRDCPKPEKKQRRSCPERTGAPCTFSGRENQPFREPIMTPFSKYFCTKG